MHQRLMTKKQDPGPKIYGQSLSLEYIVTHIDINIDINFKISVEESSFS